MDLFIGLVALIFYNTFKNFFILIIFFVLIISFYFIFLFIDSFRFLYFLLLLLLSCVADRVLVLQPGVRPEPLRWESQVQDTGPPEISQPHMMSTGESSP